MDTPITTADVLHRAREIIASGTKLEDCGMGEWCPRCAIAEAKSALDRERGTGLDLLTAARFFSTELPHDDPLVEARKMVARSQHGNDSGLSQSESIAVLDEAASLLVTPDA